jgi:exodeoxyribonuclease VII large subunit
MDSNDSNKIISVRDITNLINNKLNFTELFQIKGELSGYSKRGGNIYTMIKDKDSSIDVISWNDPNEYTNGDEVIITGKLNFYKKTARISIHAMTIEKKGMGDLFKKYILNKNNYEQKGYFDKDKKKKIPDLIENIGIITSADGAALRDVLYVLKEHNFRGNIYIKDCLVQGINASKSITNAINYFNLEKKIDLLLITRGGGSFEDLFQFSSDEVIQAIYFSKNYTISAVGHETDNMLSDYVADYRAPTPSIGAQFIVNNYLKKYSLLEKGKIIKNLIKNSLYNKKNILNMKLHNIKKFNVFEKVLHDISTKKLKLNNHIRHKNYILKNRIKNIKDKIHFIKKKQKLLDEGYCIIIDPESENTIDNINQIGYDFILIIKGEKYLIKPASIINL